MPRETLTRAEIVAAIEAGIQAAPGLTTAERIALRVVAATTDRVAVRRFKIGDCGCPLTQVGCTRDEPGDQWTEAEDETYSAFFTTFDKAVINTAAADNPDGFLPRTFLVVA